MILFQSSAVQEMLLWITTTIISVSVFDAAQIRLSRSLWSTFHSITVHATTGWMWFMLIICCAIMLAVAWCVPPSTVKSYNWFNVPIQCFMVAVAVAIKYTSDPIEAHWLLWQQSEEPWKMYSRQTDIVALVERHVYSGCCTVCVSW